PQPAAPLSFKNSYYCHGLLGALSWISRSSTCISMVVSARVGEAVGATRFIIVIQKMCQLRMQNTAIRLTILSAARSLEASALQPDFRILWNVSIFQRIAYQASFSNASLRDRTERFVISFQSIFARSFGLVRS